MRIVAVTVAGTSGGNLDLVQAAFEVLPKGSAARNKKSARIGVMRR